MPNDRVQRARAFDSTQVKAADRGLRLQPIVQVSRYAADSILAFSLRYCHFCRVARLEAQCNGRRPFFRLPHGWRGSPSSPSESPAMATKQLPESRLGSSPRNTRPTSPPARRKNVPLSPLALKMQADLQLAGLGERTQESYLRSVASSLSGSSEPPTKLRRTICGDIYSLSRTTSSGKATRCEWLANRNFPPSCRSRKSINYSASFVSPRCSASSGPSIPWGSVCKRRFIYRLKISNRSA
jgi:hypothetical protein